MLRTFCAWRQGWSCFNFRELGGGRTSSYLKLLQSIHNLNYEK